MFVDMKQYNTEFATITRVDFHYRLVFWHIYRTHSLIILTFETVSADVAFCRLMLLMDSDKGFIDAI